VVSFTPRPLYPQGKSTGTDWIGGWVGPRAVLDAVVKRKILSTRRELYPTETKLINDDILRYTTLKQWYEYDHYYHRIEREIKSPYFLTYTVSEYSKTKLTQYDKL
jgi:hypothetical protein